ncbi:hypothetical protein HanRHA438_Chr11g0493131 [Helianthus annuus]|uniref:Hydroxyproline-rich glycoprotein family protein n=1 Tax=Helianthus annuus TaxID=4232 RepID=A0A9K3HMH0_HELAN|nr:hypothetical protein HanXRQr2_Chr11g0479871 [Helianthus annuus]KAJ0500799.1 hypothetical protein HanHA300_Chr11g0393461 [Helianthus annuus]KAJ0508416.1 hypothetical protein HanIR_Chr11g0516991 [Helianthus annuus]KAJ0516670.1 hypothetical protein HanHA89_Chr11g0416431 [Helianthus annuus]KAJ0684673.1 hypothetical protein HanLR1_Chr11g0393821 [Helianthus annuus]
MASTKLLILCFLVALTLSSNIEATAARRLLNIPGFPSMGGSFPTLQTPSLPTTFPPFGSTPSSGMPFFPLPTTMPTSPSVPSFPGIFTPPATATTTTNP